MKNILFLILLAMTLSCSSIPEPPSISKYGPFTNKRPVIFVHGYAGIDRYNQNFFLYWGGTTDLERILRGENWDVRTAQCSPFGSNWDRACQLYAFIKGGRVDFGEAHSKKYGHDRFGREYPGIYPEWNPSNQIDIIAHSMGGTTSRLLIDLLENGSKEELELGTNDISPLFMGLGGGINSLTTLSTPHNGTTGVLCYRDDKKNSTSTLARNWFYSQYGKDKKVFDMKLDHWSHIINPDLNKDEQEQVLFDYFGGRITKDTALAELTVEGMIEFNKEVPDSENVYYFSWTTRKSVTRGNKEVLPVGYSNLLRELGNFMISDECKEIYGEEWVPNDGVVNTISMEGPFSSNFLEESDTPRRGYWQVRGREQDLDHWEIIGWNNSDFAYPSGYYNLTSWYIDQLKFISELPE